MTSRLAKLLDDFRQEYSAYAPIMITAPTQRCGSTLLQRAINQGGEATIYGENFYLCEKWPAILASPIRNFDAKLSITESTGKSYYSGNKGMDATALFPPLEPYIKSIFRGFYETIKFYSQDAKSHNMARWGIKHQLTDWVRFQHFINLIPNCHIFVLYRDLRDVAASHKARWPDQLKEKEQFISYGKRWADNLNYLLNIKGPVLAIAYEALIKSPNAAAKAIHNFSAINISTDVFEKKINAHLQFDDLEKITSKSILTKVEGKYIPPTKLSEQEIDWLLTEASELMKKLKYL